VADKYSTHTTKKITEYVEEKMCGLYYADPSLWLNLVKIWFADKTNQRIQRERWGQVNQLIQGIKKYINAGNRCGRTFIWVKQPDEMLRKIKCTTMKGSMIWL
jgi:hypothetical protein